MMLMMTTGGCGSADARRVALLTAVLMAVVLAVAAPFLASVAAATTGSGSGAHGGGNHERAKYRKEAQEQAVPEKCPPLLQPENIGFLVINLDRSPKRLERMRKQFDDLELPQFERVPGVEYDPTKEYRVARGSKYLKPADYGTALAHYEAWRHAYRSKHRWNVIMEDDAELLPNVSLTGPWPKVPKDADLVLLRKSSMFETSPICKDTSVLKADWGFGMVAYLVSRAGAGRMIREAERVGFRSPIDGHIWYHSRVYVTGEDWITHPPCASPCPTSIRTYLNGEIEHEPD